MSYRKSEAKAAARAQFRGVWRAELRRQLDRADILEPIPAARAA